MTYYKEHSLEYILKTKDVDMSNIYEFFFKYAKEKGKLLDIGFGSGRDMLYFKSKGFEVEGIDTENTFVEEALKLGLNVSCQNIMNFTNKEQYDYIWASASLLHIKKEMLNQAFQCCSNILKKDGIMYFSFKYGNFEGIIDNRYYIFLTEDSINNYLHNTNLKVIDYKITDDNLNRDNKWINFILKK